MDFFDSARTSDDEEHEFEERVAQPWEGPPGDVVGAVVPLDLILARTPNAVITLSHATAYATGCELAMRIRVRRGDLSKEEWSDLQDGIFQHRSRHRKPAADGPYFGIRFADGTKVLASEYRRWEEPGTPPDGPVLSENGGGGTSGGRTIEQERSFWLWPLPEPAPVDFAVEWHALGIPVTFTEIDGAAIAAAADRARPLWA